MLYIQAIFALLYFRRHTNTHSDSYIRFSDRQLRDRQIYHMQTHTHFNYYSLSLSIHILLFLTQEQTIKLSTYKSSSVIYYLLLIFILASHTSSSFPLVIPNGTSSTTAASLYKTRYHSCSGYEPGPDVVLKQQYHNLSCPSRCITTLQPHQLLKPVLQLVL